MLAVLSALRVHARDAAPVRYCQTKAAAIDTFDLQPPRHTSTLHETIDLADRVIGFLGQG